MFLLELGPSVHQCDRGDQLFISAAKFLTTCDFCIVTGLLQCASVYRMTYKKMHLNQPARASYTSVLFVLIYCLIVIPGASPEL